MFSFVIDIMSGLLFSCFILTSEFGVSFSAFLSLKLFEEEEVELSLSNIECPCPEACGGEAELMEELSDADAYRFDMSKC